MIKRIKKYISKRIVSIVITNWDYITQKKLLEKETYYRSKYQISETFRFGDLINIHLLGENIILGDHSYFNSGRINAGKNSKVQIGKWCAIGYNVNIIAKTHDISSPTGYRADENAPEKDIIIGDNVWIGSNVFIRDGVTIENNVIIGANSVVIKDIAEYSVVGGVPAKLLYSKK